ncbi:hypothetical protein [Nonomuraea sp. NPDC049709]|uniref:hypothetical protein n=1 Tax=Nonomuraea sp. NPDC049709 TaxID=3154736 RepID=UPI003441D531
MIVPGRWHGMFGAALEPVSGPGTGEEVDRGVAVSAVLSAGQMQEVLGLPETGKARLLRRAGSCRARLVPAWYGEGRDREAVSA